jgi:uncharacterized membrane protein
MSPHVPPNRRITDEGNERRVPEGVTQEEIDFWRAERQEDIKIALRHRAARARWAWILLICAVIFVGYDNRQQASRDSAQNRALIQQVQRQRADNIFNTCVTQNKQNAATREEVTREILTRSKGDREKEAALREQAKFTLRLVDRLRPTENCFERVEAVAPGAKEK